MNREMLRLINNYCFDKKTTRSEAAIKWGCGRRTLYDWTDGKYSPSVSKLLSLIEDSNSVLISFMTDLEGRNCLVPYVSDVISLVHQLTSLKRVLNGDFNKLRVSDYFQIKNKICEIIEILER